MLPEIQNFKENLPEKEQTRKIILVAKDYVYYLRRYTSIKAAGNGGDTELQLPQMNGLLVEVPKFSQLLSSLTDDLRCSTSIFLEEFIGIGGVECLLDTLRMCQARQNQGSSVAGKQQHTAIRRTMTNQHDCLLCLKSVVKNPKSVIRITDHPQGLSSIASCIMSSYCKSRVVALELLTRVLDISSRGHALVLEAMTALRVLYAEPVRFKFLVAMLNGSSSLPLGFQEAGLKFLNTLLKTSPRPADRIRLQCELEEAGFQIKDIEESLKAVTPPQSSGIWHEIEIWRRSFLDMENVTCERETLETENEKLQKEVHLLRQALKKLEEDKINLMHIEMELKEKCDDLNEEVTTLKTEMQQTKISPRENTRQNNGGEILFNGLRQPTKSDANGDVDDYEDSYSLTENGQLETEEIFIDVPTIRPPVGFRSDSSYEPNTDSFTKPSETVKVIPGGLVPGTKDSSPKTEITNSDKDSALSESESDSGINWRYPEIPEPAALFRNSRPTQNQSDASKYFLFCGAPGIRRIQRSKSEDRRESAKSRNLSDVNKGETKVVESSGFLLMRRPPHDIVSRHCSLPPRASTEQERYLGKPTKYPLPVAYRTNFLLRGHSNCDLYSGISENPGETLTPKIPPPDYSRAASALNSGGTISALVHREITKAVRQISGWI